MFMARARVVSSGGGKCETRRRKAGFPQVRLRGNSEKGRWKSALAASVVEGAKRWMEENVGRTWKWYRREREWDEGK